MDKIRSFRVVDRWTQRQHRLGSDFVVARSTPSPSFHDRGVWFNFRVLPIHEPGAAWEQSGAKHVPPRQRRILLGHFVHVARGLLSSWGFLLAISTVTIDHGGQPLPTFVCRLNARFSLTLAFCDQLVALRLLTTRCASMPGGGSGPTLALPPSRLDSHPTFASSQQRPVRESGQ
jgi:hypothetical protein